MSIKSCEIINKPSEINGTEDNSFANYTIKHRLPRIVDEIYKGNVLSREKREKLLGLKASLYNGEMEYLREAYSFWNDGNKIINQYHRNWLEVPFLFAEFFFYKKILDGVAYWQNGNDPFRFLKEEALLENLDRVETSAIKIKDSESPLKELILFNLWGNQADLSQFYKEDENLRINKIDKIIINHIKDALAFFQTPKRQVDFFLDNAGIELAADFMLGLFLIERKLAHTVVFHGKPSPMFISDVTYEDFQYTINTFQKSESPVLKKMGKQIEAELNEGKIQFQTDSFWSLPKPFIEFPESMVKHLKKSNLVICKGDLNYRRLVEDRNWNFTANSEEITSYFPTNLLILRTLKSEVMVGLSEKKVQELYEEDRNWLIDGKYGMVQLIQKNQERGC